MFRKSKKDDPFSNPNIYIREATKYNVGIPWHLDKLPHRHDLVAVYFQGAVPDGWESFEKCSICRKYFLLSDWAFSESEMYSYITQMRLYNNTKNS